MNYRHGFHAGNFADVLKHIVLTRVVAYMLRKPQPLRLIDTHAGAGRYDLTSPQATKTGEWRDGIARLLTHPMAGEAADLIAPYVAAVRAVNFARDSELSSVSLADDLKTYPGSPLIARHLLRAIDALVVNELHPDDATALRSEFARAKNTKVLELDAWTAVKSLLPPIERRGLILIDPPFEDRAEFDNLAVALDEGLKRFQTGTFMVWYPLKDTERANRFVSTLASRPGIKLVDARLAVCSPFPGLGLTETGVVTINPPFTLAAELEIILPMLVDALGIDSGAKFELHSTTL